MFFTGGIRRNGTVRVPTILAMKKNVSNFHANRPKGGFGQCNFSAPFGHSTAKILERLLETVYSTRIIIGSCKRTWFTSSKQGITNRVD